MERQIFKRGLLAAAAVAVALGASASWAPDANAVLKVKVSSGASTTTFVDEGAGDFAFGIDGLVAFVGTFGNFIVTGNASSKPFVGDSNHAQEGITSLSVSSGSGGVLEFLVTDTGFMNANAAADFLSGLSATTIGFSASQQNSNGSIKLESFIDNSNAEFGMATPLSVLGPFTVGFTDEANEVATVSVADPFSITTRITVTHGSGSRSTQFTGAVTRVPEPGTLSLAGLGLLGLGLAWRRRQKAA